MAIAFARARALSRRRGANAVRTSAYNARETLIDDRTGQRFSFKDSGTLEHSEIILPAEADERFRDPAILWSTVELAERRRDSVVAREVVLALPADSVITTNDRVAMVRAFATQHFVAKGVPVQISLHAPHGANDHAEWNPHAHILVATRKLEGDHLSSRKATEIDPQTRFIAGRRIIVEAEEWGRSWAAFQEEYFRGHGKELIVDPVAPVPGEHIGPKRFRHPDDQRIRASETIREINARIVRDSDAAARHLHDQQRPLDHRALSRFLTKHIPDPQERASVQADVQTQLHNLRRAALEKATYADMIPSGLRPLLIEDVARELSPSYLKNVKEAAKLRAAAQKTDWVRNRQDTDREAGAYRVNTRWAEMGLARRALHLLGTWRDEFSGFRDTELVRWENLQGRGKYGVQKWSIKRAAILGKLDIAERLAAAALEEIRPEAERELERRQTIARNARDALKLIDKQDNVLRRSRPLTQAPSHDILR